MVFSLKMCIVTLWNGVRAIHYIKWTALFRNKIFQFSYFKVIFGLKGDNFYEALHQEENKQNRWIYFFPIDLNKLTWHLNWKKLDVFILKVCIWNVISFVWKQEKWTIGDHIIASVTTCSRSFATIPVEIQFGSDRFKYEPRYLAFTFTRSEASHLNFAKSEVGQLNCLNRMWFHCWLSKCRICTTTNKIESIKNSYTQWIIISSMTIKNACNKWFFQLCQTFTVTICICLQFFSSKKTKQTV